MLLLGSCDKIVLIKSIIFYLIRKEKLFFFILHLQCATNLWNTIQFYKDIPCSKLLWPPLILAGSLHTLKNFIKFLIVLIHSKSPPFKNSRPLYNQYLLLLQMTKLIQLVFSHTPSKSINTATVTNSVISISHTILPPL